MATCETCGNEYDKTFTLTDAQGTSHTFDSFECAIQACAPTCEHCGCRVIGHGIEGERDEIYCCASCRRQSGNREPDPESLEHTVGA